MIHKKNSVVLLGTQRNELWHIRACDHHGVRRTIALLSWYLGSSTVFIPPFLVSLFLLSGRLGYERTTWKN